MRRLLLSLAVLLALVTASSAQGVSGIYPNPPWVAGGFVASHTDTVAAGGTISEWQAIHGWAARCADGALLNDVQGMTSVNGQPVSVPVYWGVGGPRADVDAHLQANGCASQPNAGIVFIVPDFPDGATQISIRLIRDGIWAYHTFAVAQ